jgi:hypothetical protein
MGRYETRESGVMLRLLDLTSIEAAATEKWLEKDDHAGSYLEAGFKPLAMAGAGDELYVVCQEGVGWKVTPEKPLEVELFQRADEKDGQMRSFSIMAVMVASLTPEEVLACATEEEIDLSDLIRSFGQRLEDNFWLWHATLKREMADG